MLDILFVLIDRTTIIALALVGGVVATFGSIVISRGASRKAAVGKVLLWTGYAIAGISLILFIAAGFLSKT